MERTTNNLEDLMSRRKIFYIKERTLLHLFNTWNNPDKIFLEIPKLKGLPEDANIIACYYEPQTAGFGFVVLSETFDNVETGQSVPIIETEYEIIQVERKE